MLFPFFSLKNPVLFAKCVIGCKSTKNNSKSHTFFIFFLLILRMERRVLSWAEGVIGMVWQELEGMDGMEGIPCKDTTFL
ncbi:hypothetical protein DW064_12300 [Segatella copri]|uniref:Uncharacterized protein n=1 Tax=Segatella copri TaxID=165179 RepID=A0AA92WJJ7_9BACT|nr:hypothetical protein DW064_12300 [Segatella copri]